MEIKTLCLVLSGQDFGEADRQLVLYTEELGKVSVLAPSARRSTKRFGSGVSALSFGEAVLKRNRSFQGYILEQFRGQRSFVSLAADLKRYACALYLCELCDSLFPLGQKEVQVLQMLIDSLSHLESIAEMQSIGLWLRFVEFKLLELSGLGLTVDNCSICFKKIPQREPVFLQDDQLVSCKNCVRLDVWRTVSPDARAIFSQMETNFLVELSSLGQTTYNNLLLREIKDILKQIMAKHLVRPLKIPLFWQQVID